VQPDAVSLSCPGSGRRAGPDRRGDSRGAGHGRSGRAQGSRGFADAGAGRDQVVDHDDGGAGREQRTGPAAQPERAGRVGGPGAGAEPGRVLDRADVPQRPHDLHRMSERGQLAASSRGQLRDDVGTAAPALAGRRRHRYDDDRRALRGDQRDGSR
jgi:hypothetical protein